jgi:hypothetical protein
MPFKLCLTVMSKTHTRMGVEKLGRCAEGNSQKNDRPADSWAVRR